MDIIDKLRNKKEKASKAEVEISGGNITNNFYGNTQVGAIGHGATANGNSFSQGTAQAQNIPHLLVPEEPFVAQDFIGRQSELDSIYKKFFVEKSGNILSVVNGDGGIGKTSLVSQYYHKHKDKYAHVAWVLNDSSIADSLLLLAHGLNVHFEETDNQAARLQKLLTKFAELKSPSLLVIDNVNDPEDLHNHFKLLNQCSNYFHILITSRITKFEKMDFFAIEGLPEPEAVELFKSHYSGVNSDEENLLKEIISDVGRNTLVIELFAKNMHILNELDPKYSLTNLKEDIENSLIKLSQSEEISTIYKANGNGLRNESPESIILAMYDVRELNELEKQLISIFAVLPNEKITYANIKRLFPNVKEKPLKSLSQKGWVEFDTDERSFKVNQVVQDVVKVKHKDRLFTDVGPVISSLDHELFSNDLLHKDKYKISMQLVLYAESIVQSLDSRSGQISILCLRLGDIHSKMGNLEEALKYFEDSAKLSKELHETYPQDVSYKNGLAVSYSRLGDIHSKMGKLEEALKYFEDYAQLEKELHEIYPQDVSYKYGLAASYSKLGDIHSTMGKLEEALKYFEDSAKLSKELHETYPQGVSYKYGLAISYSRLGDIHSTMGNLEEALKYFEDSAKLFKELHEAYPQDVSYKNGLAISYSKLGDIHSKMGNLEEALKYFEDSAQSRKELHETYPQDVSYKNGLAISYSKLGDIHSKMGNLEEALKYFEDSAQSRKELHETYPQDVSYKNGLSISYFKLGDIHRKMGKLEEALKYFEDSAQLEKELHETYPQDVSYKNGLAISYSKLGYIHSKMGNLKEARSFIQECINIWEELSKDYPAYVEFKSNLDWALKRMDKLEE